MAVGLKFINKTELRNTLSLALKRFHLLKKKRISKYSISLKDEKMKSYPRLN